MTIKMPIKIAVIKKVPDTIKLRKLGGIREYNDNVGAM